MRRSLVLALLTLGLAVTPSARAVDQDAIDKAIDRGVEHLRKMQRADGTWPNGEMGATALAGLTLLECGVPPSDPALKKAAEAVRKASGDLTHTYSLALAVLFLDRLGEEADVPLIESFTVRLLAGQNADGGWHYHCPNVPETEARRLTGLLKERAELNTAPLSATAVDTTRVERQRKVTSEIQEQIARIVRNTTDHRPEKGTDDNSNTQFAVMALWVARRHNLPTDPALMLINARFRSSQSADGGWDYRYHNTSTGKAGGHSTATMTCAGLLGLGVAHGALNDARLKAEKPKEGDKPAVKLPDPAADPVIRAGLLALGTSIDHPVGLKKGRGKVPTFTHGGRLYYFLWSLERVCVAFGLKTVGGKDWYSWGAEILVTNQQKDGSWLGDFAGPGADTCFALLFLKRANIARDLTTALKGKIEDPGEVTLTAGGVGGEGLKQRLGLKSATDSSDLFSKMDYGSGAGIKPASLELDADAVRLRDDLLKAAPEKQTSLVEEMRDAKGIAYTQALAAAIPKLEGDVRKKAREALAERMARMTSATLGDKLREDAPEVRRAAALACAMKEDRAHVERLIELLDDPEMSVQRAAYAALKSLSGEDHGPAVDATPTERAKSVAAWRGWWVKQRK
jgi:hypothetical protein